MEGQSFDIDPSQKLALEVHDATFAWEESLAVKEAKEAKAKSKKGKAPAEGIKDIISDDSPPFEMRNVSMLVPRGSLVAIVGAVGSGKVCISFRLIELNHLPQVIVESAHGSRW